MGPWTTWSLDSWLWTTSFVRSARGVPQAVANLELVTAPDQALFGSRIETSCGPYAAKAAGKNPKNFEDTARKTSMSPEKGLFQ